MIKHDFSTGLPSPVIPEDCEQRMLGSDDICLLIDLVGPHQVERYRERIAEGRSCSALERNGEIVAYCWSSTDSIVDDLLSFEIPVGRDEIYFYDSFTKRSERSQGLFFFLLIDGFHRSMKKGKKRAVAIHTMDDFVRVYPRYRKYGIHVRAIEVLDIVRIFFWKRTNRRKCEPELDGKDLDDYMANTVDREKKTAVEHTC